MELAFEASRALSMLAFLFYGVHCLVSPAMVAEFERYGLARLRPLTGALEILGGLGLLAGYVFPAAHLAASAGLSLLMLLGIATRLRIRDPLVACLPALALMILNACLFTWALVPGSA